MLSGLFHAISKGVYRAKEPDGHVTGKIPHTKFSLEYKMAQFSEGCKYFASSNSALLHLFIRYRFCEPLSFIHFHILHCPLQKPGADFLTGSVNRLLSFKHHIAVKSHYRDRFHQNPTR